MRIAQIAPLAESVPPRLYGGTERVVAYLTEELVRLGHDVTLFDLVQDPLPQPALVMERVRRQAHEFDVLHFHLDHDHLPFFRPCAGKALATLHGRLDLDGLAPLCRELSDMPLVSISRAQRLPLAGANWVGNVYHGLAPEVCPFNPAPRGRSLAFLGSPEKGLPDAIAIARGARMRLRIALPGELGEEAKPAFLGNAAALVFPVDRPEPFGLAMIEAMSCGTPVIAYPRGAVPEIVEDGVTGFLAGSAREAIDAVGRLGSLDRARVRRRFEERFSAERMARDYLAVYRALGRTRDKSGTDHVSRSI